MKRVAVSLSAAIGLVLLAAGAAAKLPAPSDEAKAKAAEAAAKSAWGDKVAAFQLCKAMDRVAAAYAGEQKKAGKEVKPTATPACTDPGPFAATPPVANAPAATQKPAAVKKS